MAKAEVELKRLAAVKRKKVDAQKLASQVGRMLVGKKAHKYFSYRVDEKGQLLWERKTETITDEERLDGWYLLHTNAAAAKVDFLLVILFHATFSLVRPPRVRISRPRAGVQLYRMFVGPGVTNPSYTRQTGSGNDLVDDDPHVGCSRRDGRRRAAQVAGLRHRVACLGNAGFHHDRLCE